MWIFNLEAYYILLLRYLVPTNSRLMGKYIIGNPAIDSNTLKE